MNSYDNYTDHSLNSNIKCIFGNNFLEFLGTDEIDNMMSDSPFFVQQLIDISNHTMYDIYDLLESHKISKNTNKSSVENTNVNVIEKTNKNEIVIEKINELINKNKIKHIKQQKRKRNKQFRVKKIIELLKSIGISSDLMFVCKYLLYSNSDENEIISMLNNYRIKCTKKKTINHNNNSLRKLRESHKNEFDFLTGNVVSLNKSSVINEPITNELIIELPIINEQSIELPIVNEPLKESVKIIDNLIFNNDVSNDSTPLCVKPYSKKNYYNLNKTRILARQKKFRDDKKNKMLQLNLKCDERRKKYNERRKIQKQSLICNT